MHVMEEVCERENLVRAWQRVRDNKGAPGADGMSIADAGGFLREHWPGICSQLLDGTYQPQPVRRVEIPKPDGGIRKLGVPCVVDRLIQQALLQVLQVQWDPTFSEASYGFRPGRSAHQAVAQAQAYVAEGYNVVVDLDLEKFFDRVNHDLLMARVAARVADKRVLKLIRAFLNAGVMENGLVRPVDEGTPQGGPLSPLLSNLMLDIPGLQHRERRQRAAHRANGSRQVHDAGQGVHPPDAGPVAEADRRAAAPIPDRVAQLLRLLPNPDGAHQTRSVDTPEIAHVSLAAVEDRTKPLPGAAPPRRQQVPGGSGGGFTDRVLAHVRTRDGPVGSAQPLLRRSRIAPSPHRALTLNLVEPPWYGPVCPVVWEGRRRKASPYPDQSPTSHNFRDLVLDNLL
jgi:retron-type reverse transcriptase